MEFCFVGNSKERRAETGIAKPLKNKNSRLEKYLRAIAKLLIVNVQFPWLKSNSQKKIKKNKEIQYIRTPTEKQFHLLEDSSIKLLIKIDE